MLKHSIKRLPIDTGPAGWNAILGPQKSYPKLQENRTTDFLVIGAGFAGLAAARRLSQIDSTATITILEASQVAHGPAGRNSGFMIDLPHDLASDDYGGSLDKDREQTALNRMAIAFASDAAAQYGMDEEAFSQNGKVNAAATEKGVRHNLDYAAHLQKLGEDHEILDQFAMREITGSDYYLSGLFTPKAALIQPAKFVRGLADGLTTLEKVSLFENSPVIELEKLGKDWLAKTPKGTVTASKIILAVNGHAASFGFFQGRLMHIFTYASMTRQLRDDEIARLGGRPNWAFTPADPMGTTVRRINGEGGERIVIRNRFTYDPSMQVSNKRIQSVGRDHDRAFNARFPMLKGVEMEYRWGGRLCLSYNDVPAFGEVEEGIFAACCQNGLGTAKGTLSGMMAAELAFKMESEHLAALMATAGPTKLPPEPLAWVGANAMIRIKELQAGKEL